MLQKVKNIFHLFEAVLAATYYRFPAKKLFVIGVTGTDGKTTTVNLIHHILTKAGYKAAIYSTLSSAHTTTPPPFRLQKFLAQSFKNGCTHAVLEVSSHAIDQDRIWGIPFAVGVLTNISDHEHLDYHKTFENYKNTKLRFLATCRQKVMGPELLEGDFKKILAASKLPGEFNRRNVMAAAAAARLLGIDDETIVKAVASFKSPTGRFEIVHRKPLVIVDFAHTPQAFEAVLPLAQSLRKQSKSKLIHVFGCTGNRDRSKRPIMGRIAARYDDIIILTHEDTYSEEPRKIVEEIKSGIMNYKQSLRSSPASPVAGLELGIKEGTLYEILDRREAIKKALELARPGDVVLLTGVGHQRSMNIGGKEVPWNEPKIVQRILNKEL